MAPKAKDHILTIGAEAFGLLEQVFPSSRHPAPQGPPRPERAVLNNFQAAQKYGGMVFVDNGRMSKPGQVRKLGYYDQVV